MNNVKDAKVCLASSSYLWNALCGLHHLKVVVYNRECSIALLKGEKKKNSKLKKKASEPDETFELKKIEVRFREDKKLKVHR
jgi:hypothetical protein